MHAESRTSHVLLPSLWFQVLLKDPPVHLNQSCSSHERIRSVAGELAENQAKDAGMGVGQEIQDGAAASGSSQDVPGCSRGGKRIR